MQIKVYSSAILDDAGTKSPFEYNGSFNWNNPWDNPQAASGGFERLDNVSPQQLYRWAKMMDCFSHVFFVCEDQNMAIEYHMNEDHHQL